MKTNIDGREGLAFCILIVCLLILNHVRLIFRDADRKGCNPITGYCKPQFKDAIYDLGTMQSIKLSTETSNDKSGSTRCFSLITTSSGEAFTVYNGASGRIGSVVRESKDQTYLWIESGGLLYAYDIKGR